MSISLIRNRLVDVITQKLSNDLHTQVSIDGVDLGLMNRLSLTNCYIQDQQQDTLLYMKKADLHFHFWRLFVGKVLIDKIHLDGLKFQLSVDERGENNLQFILDYLKNDTKKGEKTPTLFRLEGIEIENSSFAFYDKSVPPKTDTTHFDSHNIQLENLTLVADIDHWQGDSISGRIETLSFFEKSGLVLKNLQTSFRGLHKGIFLPSLTVSLPHSKVEIDSLSLRYDSITAFRNIMEDVRWKMEILPSQIVLKDLSAFSNGFSQLNKPVAISGKIEGVISGIQFKSLSVNYGKSIKLLSDISLSGLPDWREVFIYSDIKKMQFHRNDFQDIVARITHKPFVLPSELAELGTVKYSGNLSGFFSDLVAYGNISTAAGSLRTDILIKMKDKLNSISYDGSIKSENLNLGKILRNPKVGNIAFKLNTKGEKQQDKSILGKIKADIMGITVNDYRYENISLDGNYDGTGFDGVLKIDEENLSADFDGVVDLTQKLPILNFKLLVHNANLYALHLTDKYRDSQLAFYAKTNIVGNSIDNLNGTLVVDSLFFRNGDKAIDMQNVLLTSVVEESGSHFSVHSDFVSAIISGKYKYSLLPMTLKRIVKNYIPAIPLGENDKVETVNNQIEIEAKIAQLAPICDILELPFSLSDTAVVSGVLDDVNNKIVLDANVPDLVLGGRKFSQIVLNVDNDHRLLHINTNAILYNKEKPLSIAIKGEIISDSLTTTIDWQNSDTVRNSGKVNSITRFENRDNSLSAKIELLHSPLIINDSAWEIMPANIAVESDSLIRIDKFSLASTHQSLAVDGVLSKDREDKLTVQMKNLDVGFILNLLNFNVVEIGGSATGDITAISALKKPILEADFQLKTATLNNAPIGDGHITSNWNTTRKMLSASGKITENGKKKANITGGYFPEKDSIDFLFDAEKLNLSFLQKYLNTVVQNVRGEGTGKVRLYGNLKNVVLSGDVFAESTYLDVDFLQTSYHLSDTIYLRPQSVSMKNITVYDTENGRATVDGFVKHNGDFKEMNFDVNIATSSLLAMNTTVNDNDMFYGRIYAEGKINISGNEQKVSFDINGITRPRSNFFLQIGGASSAEDNSFISFVKKKKSISESGAKTEAERSSSSMEMDMNIKVDVTPETELKIIIDPRQGDMIAGNGSGSLRMSYNSLSTDFRVYGNYTIDAGKYLFTLQNLLRKNFEIEKGSRVMFFGDVFKTQLDLRAIYSVTASLKDLLDVNTLSSSSRTSVPVNCVLKLNNELMKPDIKFKIDLPQSDEALKMQVNNIINTDEMRNMQMMYLLLFSRFYTPAYIRSTTYDSNTNTGLSFLTTTLSGQINDWLSKMNKNLTVGVNYRTSGDVGTFSQEFEGALSYQFNDRLLINGNFGYRDDNLTTNKIIGDIDLEYLLNQSGKLRLKAFNHTIDRYTLQLSPYVQGVGILYKENFNSWRDLLNFYRRKKRNDDVKPAFQEAPSQDNDTIPAK